MGVSAPARAAAAPRSAAQPLAWHLASAMVIALAVAAFAVGTAWDTQWHVDVGRDRVLTAPHLLMLGGIATAGLASLGLVLRASWAAWMGRAEPGRDSTRVLGLFRAPFGAILAGVGALISALAFPLDDYWHNLYGIDVTLWAPFHIMIAGGMVVSGVGLLYLTADRIADAPAGPGRTAAQLAFALVLGVTFTTLLLLLPQANAAEGLVRVGDGAFVVYPALLAGAAAAALSLAALVSRLPGAASVVALVVLALRQLMFAFVPWAVEATRAAEGLVYRDGEPMRFIITPLALPPSLLLAALLVDGVVWAGRGGPARPLVILATAAAGALLAATLYQPWAETMQAYYYPDLNVAAVLLAGLPLAGLAAIVGVVAASLVARSMGARTNGGR